ncbi:MAG: efflux RND transporter periplasmic adaptor subunit [Desulfobulbaceae bacterium]
MEDRSKHLPAAERRAATVGAVVELAAGQNPDGITTAAIAGRMNLSQGALFKHFPNKEAIWLAVMEWVAGELLGRVDRAAKDSTSPVAALEAMFMTHIDFVARHPGVPRILFSELQHPRETPAKRTVRSLSKQYGERLRLLIEAGKSQGELGEMDPVDLDERISAQQAALKRAQANIQVAEAQVQERTARHTHATSQEDRYEKLLQQRSTSKQLVEDKRQERQVAEAGVLATRASLEAARQELVRMEAELDGLAQQRANLHLVAPVAGLVTDRAEEPGSTVVAGQAVVEMIDPESLWLNVRFDQLSATGLRAGLPASIALRSRAGQSLAGQVLRIEPLADAVTEEILAKVVFTPLPQPLPSVGELAEVTVALPQLASMPVVPNAAIHRLDGQLGVWVLENSDLRFTPVKLGAADLDGLVQIIEGLRGGEQVVLYSRRALTSRSRIKVVDRLPGAGS